jgi:hypothetical protein
MMSKTGDDAKADMSFRPQITGKMQFVWSVFCRYGLLGTQSSIAVMERWNGTVNATCNELGAKCFEP